MTPQLWDSINDYIHEVFGREDEALARLEREARDAGLPDIAVNAEVGRLLMLLARTTRGRLAIEVGTLGGYSAIWIARGLAASGRLITIESEPSHTAFARRQFKRADLADCIDVREGLALDVLATITCELEPNSVDVVFLDADKREYPDYWAQLKPLVAPGGLLLMDNALASSSWTIVDEGHPHRDGADRLNRLLADDPDFDAAMIPLRQGVLVARRRD